MSETDPTKLSGHETNNHLRVILVHHLLEQVQLGIVESYSRYMSEYDPEEIPLAGSAAIAEAPIIPCIEPNWSMTDGVMSYFLDKRKNLATGESIAGAGRGIRTPEGISR